MRSCFRVCFSALGFLLIPTFSIAAEDQTDQQRLQKLEAAVRQLQTENGALKKRLQELEAVKLSAGETKKTAGEAGGNTAGPASPTGAMGEAAKTKPAGFVLPWGKEAKLVLGGFLQVNGDQRNSRSCAGNKLPGPVRWV